MSDPITDPLAFTVEREAKLFEAGDYPDRGVNITEADLDSIIAGTKCPPIAIEHSKTPFDGAMGVLKTLHRKGKELFGTLAFTDPAWALAVSAGARRLSVAIKKDLSGIAEVSLVREPRVADARVFNNADVVGFSVDLDWPEETKPEPTPIPIPNITEEVTTTMSETKVTPPLTYQEALTALQQFRPGNPDAQALFDANVAIVTMARESQDEVKKAGESARLALTAIQNANTDVAIERLKREGKIVPAVEMYARAILERKPLTGAQFGSEETVRFSVDKDGVSVDCPMHFADAFLRFVDGMPAAISFKELLATESNEVTPETASMFKQFSVDMNTPAAKQAIAEMRR
jgi:hypothetical protein